MSELLRRPSVPRGSLAAALLAVIIVSIPSSSFGQTSAAGQRVPSVSPGRSYQVLSESPAEVIIRIEPKYEYNTVIAADGKTYNEVRFTGGSIMDSAGAPEAMRLILPLLAPNRTAASVQVLEQKLDVRPNF